MTLYKLKRQMKISKKFISQFLIIWTLSTLLTYCGLAGIYGPGEGYHLPSGLYDFMAVVGIIVLSPQYLIATFFHKSSELIQNYNRLFNDRSIFFLVLNGFLFSLMLVLIQTGLNKIIKSILRSKDRTTNV